MSEKLEHSTKECADEGDDNGRSGHMGSKVCPCFVAKTLNSVDAWSFLITNLEKSIKPPRRLSAMLTLSNEPIRLRTERWCERWIFVSSRSQLRYTYCVISIDQTLVNITRTASIASPIITLNLLGNAKILNAEEGNDLLQETDITTYQYL
jgi:hypothetical protein